MMLVLPSIGIQPLGTGLLWVSYFETPPHQLYDAQTPDIECRRKWDAVKIVTINWRTRFMVLVECAG